VEKSYIGITGFMASSEVLSVLDEVPEVSNRCIMVGVLASQKTVFQNLQNKWPNRYPNINEIAAIFSDHPLCLNLVHYNTKEPETLLKQMIGVTDFAGPNLHGFQLNVKWPSPKILEKYRRQHAQMKIVLQVGGGAFEAVQNSAKVLAKKVANEYVGLVDYILLDPSGGFGQPFDTKSAREYLEALREKDVERFLGLGVAGGLSPTTFDLVEPLVGDYPNLSIDAEGRLRDENDILDKDLAKEYVARALHMFAG
jgi:hypothetical protein